MDVALSLCARVRVKLFQLCLTLWNPMDCSSRGYSVHGIFQARILEWVACLPPGDLPNPGFEHTSLMSPALAGVLYHYHHLGSMLPIA